MFTNKRMIAFTIATAMSALSATAQTQPTPEQMELRGRLLYVGLAHQCSQKFGDKKLLEDAITSLRKAAAKLDPKGAADVERRVREGLANTPQTTDGFSSLADTATCDRVRAAIAADLRE